MCSVHNRELGKKCMNLVYVHRNISNNWICLYISNNDKRILPPWRRNNWWRTRQWRIERAATERGMTGSWRTRAAHTSVSGPTLWWLAMCTASSFWSPASWHGPFETMATLRLPSYKVCFSSSFLFVFASIISIVRDLLINQSSVVIFAQDWKNVTVPVTVWELKVCSVSALAAPYPRSSKVTILIRNEQCLCIVLNRWVRYSSLWCSSRPLARRSWMIFGTRGTLNGGRLRSWSGWAWYRSHSLYPLHLLNSTVSEWVVLLRKISKIYYTFVGLHCIALMQSWLILTGRIAHFGAG